jgi:hypothetical protein
MNRPAFLVDGYTEKLVLEKLCPNKKINRINCNGNSVSIESLAKRICSLIRLMNNNFYPIIILVDREERELTSAEMQIAIKEEIEKSGINNDIRIGVCDRMIENWILSDWENFIKRCNQIDIEKPDNTDGIKGKAFIKRLYPNYQETTDGVNLLLQSDPSVLYSSSPSFKKFVDQLKDIKCDWLNCLAEKICDSKEISI